MTKIEVPNGGWGWMVVFGSAVTNMVNQSLLSLFGLIYREKLEEMGHGTVGAALVMNISSMVTNFSGLITGPVLKSYSARSISMLGVFLTAAGMILSSMATNLSQVIISYSIFTGLGLGLIIPATFMSVNAYFTTKKSQAVGLSMAGTGMGQMLMPQVVRFLLDEFGYKGTTLILGALCLHGIPASMLFHPVEWHSRREENAEMLLEKPKPQEKKIVPIKNRNARSQKSETIFQKVATMLDLTMLKDLKFLHIVVGLGLVYTCSVSFSMVYPYFLQESVGLSRADTALCMSLLSGADILARLTIPVVTTRMGTGARTTFVIGSLALALIRSVLAEQTTFELTLITAILCGYIRAATVINQNLTVSEYCTDEKRLPSALGLNMVAKGLTVLVVGQFFGWIRDYSKSFPICIHIQSAVMVFVAATWIVEMAWGRLFRRKTSVPTSPSLEMASS